VIGRMRKRLFGVKCIWCGEAYTNREDGLCDECAWRIPIGAASLKRAISIHLLGAQRASTLDEKIRELDTVTGGLLELQRYGRYVDMEVGGVDVDEVFRRVERDKVMYVVEHIRRKIEEVDGRGLGIGVEGGVGELECIIEEASRLKERVPAATPTLDEIEAEASRRIARMRLDGYIGGAEEAESLGKEEREKEGSAGGYPLPGHGGR
jgi:hypothetical protein